MGYTHHWYRVAEFNKEDFINVAADFKKLMPVFEALSIKLANGNGKGRPKISEEVINFNGLEACGHNKRNLGITWPADHASGVAQIVVEGEPVTDASPLTTQLTGLFGGNLATTVNTKARNATGDSDVGGTWYAGTKLNQRTCGGDCSHETFYFPRIEEIDKWKVEDYKKSGVFFCFTKTAYKPYDFAVNCALIIADHYLRGKVFVHSDGELEDWQDAIKICQKALGYGSDFDFRDEPKEAEVGLIKND
mgnify:CR=1 FL=1